MGHQIHVGTGEFASNRYRQSALLRSTWYPLRSMPGGNALATGQKSRPALLRAWEAINLLILLVSEPDVIVFSDNLAGIFSQLLGLRKQFQGLANFRIRLSLHSHALFLAKLVDKQLGLDV